MRHFEDIDPGRIQSARNADHLVVGELMGHSVITVAESDIGDKDAHRKSPSGRLPLCLRESD
jgi:hypothetical protein